MTELQRAALGGDDLAVGVIGAEELFHHDKRLRCRHNARVRILGGEAGDVGGVVRLHVLHDEVIRLTVAQHLLHILQPFVAEARIHRIHHSDVIVQNHIRIIRHSVFDNVLTFEQVDVVVVHADIGNIFGDSHDSFLRKMILRILYAVCDVS